MVVFLFKFYKSYIHAAYIIFDYMDDTFCLCWFLYGFWKIIQKIYLRNKTFYVITNKKLMIKKGRKIQIYNGNDLPPMEIKIHNNGLGTIIFSEFVYTERRRYHRYIMLENLIDVVQVQNAIEVMKGSKS